MRPLFFYSDLQIHSRFSRLFSENSRHRSTNRSHPTRLRRSPGGPFRGRLLRTLICHAIILNLLIWPSPRVTFGALTNNVSNFAGTAGSLAITVAAAVSSLRSVPVVFIPSGPIVIPVPMLPIWPFQLSTGVSRDLSMVERTARVAAVKISPNKQVGYVGDSITFVAMGVDIAGQPAHGAKFTWESSQPENLTIDDAGQAKLLHLLFHDERPWNHG